MEYVLQGGALGLLAYIIFWTTKSGAPNLFTVMGGIRDAIHTNTSELRSLKFKQEEHTVILRRLVERVEAGSE